MCEKGFRNEQDTPDIESADKYYSESVGIGGPEMPETQLLLGEYYFNRWNDCDYTLPGDNDDPSFEDVLKSRAAYWYKKLLIMVMLKLCITMADVVFME